ncbi:hypothetical protein [Microbacterium sp. HJ5]
MDDRPHALLELLWLREAHGLSPVGDGLPPLLVDTPTAPADEIDDETRGKWEGDWPSVWRDVVAHAGEESDPQLYERLPHTEDGSAEREAILRALVGPSWADHHDRDVFNDASYLAWEQSGMEAFLASQHERLADSPERREVDALVPAWRAGLTKVITIPCRGELAQRIGAHGLLLTHATRATPDRYRRALRSFVG